MMKVHFYTRMQIIFIATMLLIPITIGYVVLNYICASYSDAGMVYWFFNRLLPLAIFSMTLLISEIIIFSFFVPIVNSMVTWKNKHIQYLSLIIMFVLMVATYHIATVIFVTIVKIKNNHNQKKEFYQDLQNNLITDTKSHNFNNNI